MSTERQHIFKTGSSIFDVKRPVLALLCVACVVFLSGCETMTKARDEADLGERLKPSNIELHVTPSDLAKSAQAPLYDLNIKRDEIPASLIDFEQLYVLNQPVTCDVLLTEIAALTEILGSDPGFSELADDGSDEDKDYKVKLDAGDALEDSITDYIPYSSMIRRISGAHGHEKKMAEAFLRGQLRRAFLNGTARNMECDLDPVKIGEAEPPALFVQTASAIRELPSGATHTWKRSEDNLFTNPALEEKNFLDLAGSDEKIEVTKPVHAEATPVISAPDREVPIFRLPVGIQNVSVGDTATVQKSLSGKKD